MQLQAATYGTRQAEGNISEARKVWVSMLDGKRHEAQMAQTCVNDVSMCSGQQTHLQTW